MGDDSPVAEGQGQTAGTGAELVTTGAQAAVIKKNKCKRTVTKAQMAVKEEKWAQLGSRKTGKPTLQAAPQKQDQQPKVAATTTAGQKEQRKKRGYT